MTPPSTDPSSVVAGRYKLGAVLGRGGQGIVYEAEDLHLQQVVALKVLNVAPENVRKARRLLEQEFYALSRLQHPNVVRVLDFGELEGLRPFLVMERVGGRDLSRVPRLDRPRFASVFVELAQALSFVHSRRVVHRDIKPTNVRLVPAPDGAEHVILLDFGLAIAEGSRTQGVAGTPHYLAPESYQGGALDARADLYSLGVLMYQSLVGELPRVLPPNQLSKTSITRFDLSPLNTFPAALVRLLRMLLADSPSRRPASADVVVDVLAGLVGLDGAWSMEQKRSYLSTPALVGRAEEFALLRTAFERAREGTRGAILVGGAAGGGKSRLLEELALEARIGRARVVGARARRDAGSALAVVFDALDVLVHEKVLDEDAALRAAAPMLVRAWPRLAELLPEVEAAPPLADPDAERARALEAIKGWLLSVARNRTLVMVLDDLQWADSHSLELLDRLLAERDGPGALLVVGAFRDDDLQATRALDRLVRLFPGAVLRIRPFDADQVRDLVQQQFAPSRPSDLFVSTLLRRTGGNPYILQEVLRYLVETGRIDRVESSWRLPEVPAAIEVPEGLGDILEAHLAACSPAATEVLRLLAVARRTLNLDTLVRAVADPKALTEAVHLLVVRDLATSTAAGVTVRHDLLLDHVAQRLPPGAAPALHMSLARAMRGAMAAGELTQGEAGYSDAEIGRHFQLAGAPDEALGHLLDAGNRSFQLQAHREAWQVLSWASEILRQRPYTPGGDLDVVEAKLLNLAFHVLDPREAIHVADRIRERLLGIGWLSRLADLRRWGGALGLLTTLGVTQLSLRQAGTSASARELYSSLLLATAYRAASLGWLGQFRDAHDAAEREVMAIVPAGRSLPWALATVAMAHVKSMQGRSAEVAAGLEDALAIVSGRQGASLRPHDRVTVTLGGGIILAAGAAVRGLPDPMRLAEPPSVIELPDGVPRSLEASRILALAPWRGQRGELAALQRDIRWFNDLRVRLRPQVEEWVDHFHAAAAVEAGDFEQARGLARRFRHMGRYSEAMALVIETRCPGPLDRRLELGERAVGLAARSQLDAPRVEVLALLALAEAEVDEGRARAALARAERTLVLARNGESRYEWAEAEALRLLALALAADGRDADALASLDAALEVAEALENPLLTAKVCLARARVAGPRDGEAWLTRGEGLAQTLENQRLVAEARDLLASWSLHGLGAEGAVASHGAFTIDEVARLTQTLDLPEIAASALALMGDILRESRRTLWLFATPDTPELVFVQAGPQSDLLNEQVISPGVAARVRAALELGPDPRQLEDARVWVYPLRRADVTGSSGDPPFGVFVVELDANTPVPTGRLQVLSRRLGAVRGPIYLGLEHARLAQREYRLSLLNQLGHLLNAVHSVESLVTLVLDRMLDASGADRAALLLADEDGGPLQFVAARSADRATLAEGSFQILPTLVAEAVEGANLVRLDSRSSRSDSLSSQMDVRAVLAVPLRSLLDELGPDAVLGPVSLLATRDYGKTLPSIVEESVNRGRVVGVVYLELGAQGADVGDSDEALLRLLAAQAGFAIDTARLRRRLREEAVERERLQAREDQLRRYLSRDVARAVLADPQLQVLGARSVVLTALFTDVRGFTRWSAERSSEQVVETLNEIFTVLTPIVFKHGGTLDKYLGDGLLALFGAPISMPDHARQAVLAAREMQEAVTGLIQGWPKERRVPGMGVGIHTGQASVGNIGSPERMEYTAVGDVVNVASRVCGLARPGQTLITEQSAEALPVGMFATRALLPVRVKGRDEPLFLFEVT